MSLYDYQQSREIATKDYGFNSLIMAAMRNADDFNLAKLSSAFPETYFELKERYNAPGGKLKDD